MNRKHEQADLIFRFGLIVGPVIVASRTPDNYESDERDRIIARMLNELPKVIDDMRAFCTSEPGHNYATQSSTINQLFRDFRRFVMAVNTLHSSITIQATKFKDDVIRNLLSIPVPIDAAIHEAMTPFSTYRLLKDLGSTCRTRLTWFDRYFHHSFFHRHLADVPASVSITVVTWPKSKCKGASDTQRFDEFVNLSRTFAAERGPSKYRLVTTDDIHSRWVRFDDRILVTGESIKDIDRMTTFTVSRIDNTPENHKALDDVIAGGTELFGPLTSTHP